MGISSTACSALAFLACTGFPLAAQETRGTIHGRVTDPQLAVIPGASVTVTNTETNAPVRLKTNATGYYAANLLLPGEYRVAVEAGGFRGYVQNGIVLPVGTQVEINVQLEIGATTETIAVTAEAPMLDTNAVTSGRVLDNRSLMDLPVLGNSVTLLAKLTPGIYTGGVNNYLGLHSNSGGSDYYVAGRVGGNEWSVDGVPNAGDGRRMAYLPYSDTVQEFKVETSNFDASIGHGTGASISMMTKAGGNTPHGSLTWQHWQQRWNGTPFFVKQLYYRNIAEAEARGDAARAAELRSQDKQPSGRSNNYAATVGGPVVIPKIVNGKDKLFFFFSFNGFRDSKREEANDIPRTFPGLADRAGDFSRLLAVDPVRYQIHDPLTVRPDPARPTHFIRDPIPGNVLPRSRMVSPIYNYYTKLLPTPNNEPADTRAEPRRNYMAVLTPFNWDYKAYSNRVDYQHSERHRFFGRWSWNDFIEDRGDWFYESARGLASNGLNRHNLGATVDWVWTRGSSTMLDVAVAGNEFRTGTQFAGDFPFNPLNIKPSDTGLPAYMDARADDRAMLPFIDFPDNTYNDIGRSGYPTYTRYRVLTAKADATHIRGRHTVRGGLDARQQFRTGGGGGHSAGRFQFDNRWTRRYDDTVNPAGDFGHLWAAFAMGLPSNITMEKNDSYATHNPYYGWYAQDNWRLTPRLTVNLGLRMEYQRGGTERYNRMIGGFNPTAELPITAAAQAAYARSPLPELPAARFQAMGGAVYPGVGGVNRNITESKLTTMPRISAAYALDSRTVLRAGYGLFVDVPNVLVFGPDQSGYSRGTSTPISTDFGMTWLAGNPRAGISPLADPFPVRPDGTRFNEPTNAGLGVMAKAGRGWDYVDYTTDPARSHRWRIGVQRQIGANMVVEASYAGAASDRIGLDDVMRNPLPESFWADGMVRNNANASNMTSNVANPFRLSNFSSLQQSHPLAWQDISTQGFFTGSTVPKHRLLRPFPHMNGDVRRDQSPLGRARSDGLELRFERRMAKGLLFNLGYTKLRNREADFFYYEWDAAPSWRESNDGRPHRLVASGIFELPFGQGKPLAASGPLALAAGGWQIGLTYEYQPGALLGFGNLFYYGNIEDIRLDGPTLDRWFNTDNFERTPTRTPASYHRRMFPTRLDGVRQDMTNQWNANLQRRFKLRERGSLELRVDALNLQNRSQFAGPSTSPASTDFGRVTSQSDSTNRWIQLQARVRF